MKYRELIKEVQHRSGFSDQESRDALQLLVECIAVRLTEGERKDFASQLPTELQDIALSVMSTDENRKINLVEQFMEIQGITRAHAKKQILSAWKAITSTVMPGEIRDVRSQLNQKTASVLF